MTHVAIVHLAFARTPSARDLLARYPLLTHYCTGIGSRSDLRVTVLGRFWRDEDFETTDTIGGVTGRVTWHFRADDPDRGVAMPWTHPRGLYRLLDEIAPDVVQVNGLMFPGQVASLRWRLPRTTALLVRHHGERPSRTRVRWGLRLTHRCVDGFLFSAGAIADEWRAAGGIGPRQPVYHVLVSSSPFHLQAKDDAREALRSIGASSDAQAAAQAGRVEHELEVGDGPSEGAHASRGVFGDPAVLWVGRLHPRKAPLLALDAFDRARVRLRDPHLFLIYGEDLLAEVLRFCADPRRPGLAERVHLVGRVPHAALAPWLNAADLFITSSPAESANMALIESLSCGLLPVCSDIPAHRALTRDGEAGLLFPYGDAVRGADAIVEAAARVARDGEEGRRRLRGYFDRHLSWPVIAERAAAAYEQASRRRRQA